MQTKPMSLHPLIDRLVPYVPGKPIEETRREYGLTDIVKLASNENPLGASPKVIEALKAHLDEIHLYPDAAAFELRKVMAEFFGVRPTELVFGNGSNEFIDLLIHAYCFEPHHRTLGFEHSFIAYPISTNAAGFQMDRVPVNENFQMDVDKLIAAFRPGTHRLVFLVNPNNPTGAALSKGSLEKVLNFFQTQPEVLVILDEAYVEFARNEDFPNSLELRKAFPDLVILRTAAKAYGLAGLRMGTLIGSEEVCSVVNRIRGPFNVNSLAQVAMIAAVKDQAHVAKVVEVTHLGLDYLAASLISLGVHVFPSQGNFIFCDLGRDAGPVVEGMLRKGVIIRPLKNYGLGTHVRITVGTMAQNQRCVKALKEVLEISK
ncbi:MAG: histidinol-phosphate transaminase [Bdellovibrionales bacterium]|nr:histidinol-phosphate transaminase [Bdellovibrionales bacterium]